jgi:hypothetical protein
MARTLENPDRNFSADSDVEENFESLRYALAHSAPPLPFSEAAEVRFGKIISDAFLKTKRRSR